LDGILAVTESEMLLQQSQQAPEPQHRLDWVVNLNREKKP